MAAPSFDPRSHRISAVVPCYNESECLSVAYEQIKNVLADYAAHELIFVDDGSTDRTLEQLRELARTDPHVVYISFTRNFGLEAAFTAGYRYASHTWIVQLDADLQSPPAELPKLLSEALKGYDVVFAMRVQRQDPLWRRLGSRLQHWVAQNVLGIELPHRGSIFRVIRTSVAKKIVALDLGMPYFLATVPLVGARYTSVPTEHHQRLAGRAKWNLRRLVAHTVELYTGYSLRPLVFVRFCGLLGVLGGVAVLVAALLGHDLGRVFVPFAMVVGLLDLAILSLYVTRVIRGLSRGPAMYLVREANIPIRREDALYECELPEPRAVAAP